MNPDLRTLTPTQRRMWNVLKDGEPHSRDELSRCLNDDMALVAVTRQHISILRRKLKPLDLLILLEQAPPYEGNAQFYRLVRVYRPDPR